MLATVQHTVNVYAVIIFVLSAQLTYIFDIIIDTVVSFFSVYYVCIDVVVQLLYLLFHMFLLPYVWRNKE